MDGEVERSETGTNRWWCTNGDARTFYRIKVNMGE
jgi:hypothetical protein